MCGVESIGSGAILKAIVTEVGQATKKISASGAARADVRSTKASAKLEGRIVTYTTRSAVTSRYIAARPARTK
jgi:hypothetical protein